MEKIKSVFEKIIQYAGIFCSLLLVLLIISNNEFENAGMSVLLVGVTVLFLYAIFKIIYTSNKKGNTVPDLNSGIFIFGFSMVAVLAVFIRMIAFMLIDIDIMGKRALITYIYTILCFVIIYIAGRLLGGHKSGLASSVIYTILCPFDVYPAMNNLNSGGTKAELIIDYAATLLMVLSFIAAILAIKSEKTKNATFFSITSGAVLGVCMILQKNAAIAAVCMMILFILTRTSYKYVGGETMKCIKYKSYKYVLFFLIGFSVFAAGAIISVYMAGFTKMVPEWVLYLNEYDSAVAVFRYVDEMLTSMWGGIYFERNLFITYFSLLIYVFALVACAAGCRIASRTKNTQTVFAIVFPVAVSILGILECGDVAYIYNAIPFVLILAGYGVTNATSYVIIPAGEISENKPIIPLEIEQELIERIEKKYVLPEGCAAVHIVSDDNFEQSSEIDEEYVADEDTEDIYDSPDVNYKKSENVVSGNDLDSMLDNLFGNYEIGSSDNSRSDNSVEKPVGNNTDAESSGGTIFK